MGCICGIGSFFALKHGMNWEELDSTMTAFSNVAPIMFGLMGFALSLILGTSKA
jgi:hypothetical protein